MPKSKRSGASYKNQYKAYNAEERRHNNRIKKLQRVVRQQPNNKQAMQALDNTLLGKDKKKSGRRSGGHICKGLYKELDFEENKPTDKHKKALHWYHGEEFNFRIKDHEATLAMHESNDLRKLNNG